MVTVFFNALAALTLLLAWRVDLNAVSLNYFYRNRLVRCFLTGGDTFATEDRRATSFFFTPYSLGASQTGFRNPKSYGDLDEGFRLGAAMAISSSGGYRTSAATSLLRMFFGVRVGRWVPNPRNSGGMNLSLFNLLNQWFRTASDNDRYIYLDNGGLFENLGVYELMRRQCQWIVVGDAADKAYVSKGLDGLIRKCWIDLGVQIAIDDVYKIRPPKDGEFSPKQFALGTITYRDGTQGTLLYLKSSLSGAEPADVLQYYDQNKNFPHESTGDQFFSESQFESYRKLGQFIARKALDHQSVVEDITIAQAIIATQ